MIKAVFRDGVIYPLEPVPADWLNGCELVVQGMTSEEPMSLEEIDRWYDDMNELASKIEEGDMLELDAALAEADAQAKAQVRREMGLSQ